MLSTLACVLPLLQTPSAKAQTYEQQVGQFRQQVEKNLKEPSSWLAVAGLFWLKEGDNGVGSGEGNTVVLPKRAPATVGKLIRTGSVIRFEVDPSAHVKVNGKEAHGTLDMLSDQSSKGPSLVSWEDVQFYVIQRGSRIGIRMTDPQSEARKNFKGLSWYKVNPKLRIVAKWIPHDPIRQIMITNVLGDVSPNPNPGKVTFTVGGKSCSMEAIDEGGSLFFNFHDLTSGHETYGAGRFLNTAGPKDGKVIVDFNYAVNPPCAFTAFATCPLPPKENFLDVKIDAGEKFAGHH